jgi:hypothetical protein
MGGWLFSWSNVDAGLFERRRELIGLRSLGGKTASKAVKKIECTAIGWAGRFLGSGQILTDTRGGSSSVNEGCRGRSKQLAGGSH